MKKFLIGCGILTGVGILVLVGISFFAVRWVKNNAPDLERLEQYEADMTEAFGEPGDFVPPSGGNYELSRARVYVRVRENLYEVSAPLRVRMQADLAGDGPSKKGVRKIFAGIKSGAAYLRDSFEYLADADSVLLEADMGRGEYVHWTGLLVRGGMSIRASDFLDYEVDKDDRGAIEALGIEFEDECRKVFMDQFDNLRRATGPEANDPWIRLVQDARAEVRREDGVWPFTGASLPEPVATIFRELEYDLRRTAPRDAAELLLDNVLGAMIDDDQGGVRVNFD
jgi:hypothetical protein